MPVSSRPDSASPIVVSYSAGTVREPQPGGSAEPAGGSAGEVSHSTEGSQGGYKALPELVHQDQEVRAQDSKTAR